MLCAAPCPWFSVQCDVADLGDLLWCRYLYNNNLTSLPESIGNLTQLRELYVSCEEVWVSMARTRMVSLGLAHYAACCMLTRACRQRHSRHLTLNGVVSHVPLGQKAWFCPRLMWNERSGLAVLCWTHVERRCKRCQRTCLGSGCSWVHLRNRRPCQSPLAASLS